ncbi:GntR family transcriptional regulator [Nocardia neocaledoniensis NBRC 108232]|uniref:GntR family transcriptional regulator n=1 Tax=Nocardia neocaledoniensis TaxID=236511 RepID=A0A317P0D4_9NOCA|nr:GntR family transcriptional regulator [Nocardia neocaledoniensis]PWV81039.1 GntR family transcriptional regulator [Nocardia neocaledoniensis]GEM32955.1 GntR family transcriptional regulator [Nocardia neocaledoniensis NBRC 108232]
MNAASIPPLRRRTGSVSAEVAAHLERLIIDGTLSAGDRLPPERELAATLEVSRSSLREAMFELESKKLVERRQGRGSTVTELARGAAELHDNLADLDTELGYATELRELVEPRIAQLAAQRAVESNLLSLHEVLERSHESLGPEESMALDIEFHSLLAHSAQNPLLVTLCTMTTEWTRHTRVLSHRTRLGRRISVHGHTEILRAVDAHDGPAAAAAMEQHLREVREISSPR